ncbi:fungal pheromone STE3G-protein-coupled receptor [Peniophora sp. CONT]|nr:fungal pheromone STE3G-protein-coupled receptor [Peniophora sp. CONT]
MGAVDPSYPLLPIASILAAVMLFLVLLTASIRQQWNFGVALLCFWLLLQNATGAANTIIWSDNADVKLLVYCDIGSPLIILTIVIKPMATLIITRRLYLIVSMQTIDIPNKTAVRLDYCRAVPEPCAHLFADYVDQSSRFEVDEGFGCTNAAEDSIYGLLVLDSWSIIFPMISIICYYPRVARTFYLRSRDVNQYLRSNDSTVSRTNYFRLLALASIDILVTLPNGIISVVLNTTAGLEAGSFPFYSGWHKIHSDWQPVTYTYDEILAAGSAYVAEFYGTFWSALILSFVIFALFGTTAEAIALYWRIISGVARWFGWRPTPRVEGNALSTMGTMQFAVQHQRISLDAELG